MPKLTKAEKSWVNKLNKLLSECPSTRIGFYTIGDNSVMLYDSDRENEIGDRLSNNATDWCVEVRRLDAGFDETIEFPNAVLSTAG